MTVWTVEKDHRGWSVVKDGQDYPRRTLTGLSCITARVIRDELERAYQLGREEERGRVFASLEDDNE